MATGSSSGGGIVRGGPGASQAAANDMRSFRRRWASGVSVVTVNVEQGFRGATVSGLLPLSVDPPTVALSFEADAAFQHFLQPGTRIGISILDRSQEFLSERFAGRAPVPDASFSGVSHQIVDGVPLLTGAIAAGVGEVMEHVVSGDHILVIAGIDRIELGPDTDDPMLLFEGRYRSLEIS
jgi:flavin reductase (DIM6/NTAB) family NADH-FMN oxidoreductase RutF